MVQIFMPIILDKNIAPEKLQAQLYIFANISSIYLGNILWMVKLQTQIYPDSHKDLSSRSLNYGQLFVELAVQSLLLLGKL